MLDPVRLLLLRELADRGTMTAVAAACGYTSSAMSQQLAALEREAGVRLLERAGRRVRLTHEGRRLVAHARIVLGALETAEHDLRAADTPRGPETDLRAVDLRHLTDAQWIVGSQEDGSAALVRRTCAVPCDDRRSSNAQ
jgi:DNA-binding transcriptional LysR family regulator